MLLLAEFCWTITLCSSERLSCKERLLEMSLSSLNSSSTSIREGSSRSGLLMAFHVEFLLVVFVIVFFAVSRKVSLNTSDGDISRVGYSALEVVPICNLWFSRKSVDPLLELNIVCKPSSDLPPLELINCLMFGEFKSKSL